MTQKFNAWLSDAFLFISTVLILVAVLEKVSNVFGYTFLKRFSYEPGRLLEFAAVFLIFVIATVLRQLRQSMTKA